MKEKEKSKGGLWIPNIHRKTLTLCMKKEEKPKGFMHTKQDLKTVLSVWRKNKEEKPRGLWIQKQDPKNFTVCNEERRKT